MVHELIGIKKNRVTLPGAREELKVNFYYLRGALIYKGNHIFC